MKLWAAFSFQKKTRFVFIDENQESFNCAKNLKEYLLPFAATEYEDKWII